MNKQDRTLDYVKQLRWIGLFDSWFDTLFLVFIWWTGYRTLFWILLVLIIMGHIFRAKQINKLEKNLGVELNLEEKNNGK